MRGGHRRGGRGPRPRPGDAPQAGGPRPGPRRARDRLGTARARGARGVGRAVDETAYWQCVEAIDAADEARDRVLEMLRKLADRDRALAERETG
ncbi:DUF6099 family protein [Streptomyces sp. KMM 9044]|uniref:DUF6099 family protein n=1 Tax=Streptomyces sp. KMM 9044 TaxID=2744474 RepID=UPI003FA74204